MLQVVYVVYVAVYAFLLRRARALVGEIPCQTCKSEILGIDVTSTTTESLKESKEQLASPEVVTISKVSNCLREASHIWVEVDRAASWPSCHYLKKCHFFFYFLTALGTWNPKPTDHHACLLPGRRWGWGGTNWGSPWGQICDAFIRGDGGGSGPRHVTVIWCGIGPRIYHLGLGTKWY